MVMLRSWSHLTFVSPRRNQSSSPNTDRVWIFFVVTSGNPAVRSKRIWCPKTRAGPGAGAVALLHSFVEDPLEEIEVGLHVVEPRSSEVHGSGHRGAGVAADPDLLTLTHSTCTRPARRSAVPWLATYDVGSRPPASHWPIPALSEPVTGSSGMP